MRGVGRINRVLRDLLHSKRAATAVELALVGPFLILVVLMIIENGLMLFAQSVMDNATVMAARQIELGNVATDAGFRSILCSYTSTLFNCSGFQFYVASSSSNFMAVATPTQAGTFSPYTFSTGSPNDYVIVEVAYDRSYISPWLISLGKGWVLLSTTAFQNEPPT